MAGVTDTKRVQVEDIPAVVSVLAGEYLVGNDLIPNARPAHCRRLTIPVWIDVAPVTWSDFENFVAGAGYSSPSLWPGGNILMHASGGIGVDSRCVELLDATESFRRSLSGKGTLARHQPLTGITWFEAAAIAAFFGARLAFEIEWEIAMRWPSRERSAQGSTTALPRCTSMVGVMQEWTLDAFSPIYWRADHMRLGIPFVPGPPAGAQAQATSGPPLVSIRGSAPSDVYQQVSARVGRGPETTSPERGFRRVWEAPPNPVTLAPVFSNQSLD